MEVEKYSADLIFSHFKNLNVTQQYQIKSLYEMYKEWNEKINIISRKDFENLYLKHILHSLAIAKFLTFTNETKILDVGTGGGFPGIPLAILFPHVQFHLVDSIGKKIKIVDDVIRQLGITNATAENVRAEQLKMPYDFVISRAVAETQQIIQWTQHLIRKKNINALPNGWLLLKGGNLVEEMKNVQKAHEIFELNKVLKYDFFSEKYLVYVTN